MKKTGEYMKYLLLLLTLCMTNLVYAEKKLDCDYKFKKYCAKLKFDKEPSRSYSSDFKIFFKDIKSGKPVMPKEAVYPYLWMKMKNGHEHGSAKVEITREKDHFDVKNVWFVMIGNWELFLTLKKDGKILEKEVKIIEIPR